MTSWQWQLNHLTSWLASIGETWPSLRWKPAGMLNSSCWTFSQWLKCAETSWSWAPAARMETSNPSLPVANGAAAANLGAKGPCLVLVYRNKCNIVQDTLKNLSRRAGDASQHLYVPRSMLSRMISCMSALHAASSQNQLIVWAAVHATYHHCFLQHGCIL